MKLYRFRYSPYARKVQILFDQAALIKNAQRLLAPTLRTLAACEFLFGAAPTLADAGLYGLCKMLEEADPALLPRVAEALPPYLRRVEAHAKRA